MKINDRELSIAIPAEVIRNKVREIAKRINSDLAGERPVFIAVLNGAFLFIADLVREITVDCEVTFVRVSSYSGQVSTGNVKTTFGLTADISGRTVVLVEDIVDTGATVMHLLGEINAHKPKEIRIAALLLKPNMLKHDVKLDYVGFEMPDDFLVGYGLDYDGLGRNLSDIYSMS